MSTTTGISWTQATWSPITGCTRVSRGCKACYAERLTATRLSQSPRYAGLAVMRGNEARWTNEVRCHDDLLDVPLRWRKPKMIFVNSMSDTFHEKVPFEFLDKLFAVMALCPQHTFQVLTKRPERAVEYLTRRQEFTSPIVLAGDAMPYPPMRERKGSYSLPYRNVWLGTSIEDQAATDERIPHLLMCPAVVRFLSCEPLLGGINLDLDHYESPGWHEYRNHLLHWVIIGVESNGSRVGSLGDFASEAHWLAAAIAIMEQCKAAGVPVHVKQIPCNGRVLHDVAEFPEPLQFREWPARTAAASGRNI